MTLKALRCLHRWVSQIGDPVWAAKGVSGYIGYLSEWWRYTRMAGSEPIHLLDSAPCLHDHTSVSLAGIHYFNLNGWAMRRIVEQRPAHHVDVGSETIFANLLAALLPVTFVDYRPLRVNLSGLGCMGANLLALPFSDRSVRSLSCLHVAEHVGLGRYGDALDTRGTRQAAAELERILTIGGDLFFAVPVGKPRLCFNAHRVHQAASVVEYFPDLELVEFSGESDDGLFVERADLADFDDCDYACGFFWFRRPLNRET